MDGKGVKWDPVPDLGYDSIGQLPGLEDVVLPSVNEDMTRQSTGTNDVAFQIFAKTLCGKSVSLRVDPTTTVMELKSKIALIENLKGGEIRILCGGKDLHDDQETLSEHGIREMTKITILARLRGGAWNVDDEVCLGNGEHQVDPTDHLQPLSAPSFSTDHVTGARYSPPRHPGMRLILSPAQVEFTLALVHHHRILTRWPRLRGDLSFNLAEYTWSMVHMPEDNPCRWSTNALDMLDAFGHAAFQIPWENASASERVIMMVEYAAAGPSPSPILSVRIEDSIAALPAIADYFEFVDDLLFLGSDTNDVELIHNIVDSVDSNTTYSETQMTSPA
jgi:ubiquitin-like protein Nedd8